MNDIATRLRTADDPPRARRGRDARVAATYRPDDRMERLLALRQRDPAAFDKLPSGTKLSLGYYVAAKEAAEREAASRG